VFEIIGCTKKKHVQVLFKTIVSVSPYKCNNVCRLQYFRLKSPTIERLKHDSL